MLCGFVSETFDGFRPSARQTGTVTRSNRTTSGEVWVNIYLERQCAGGGHEFGRHNIIPLFRHEMADVRHGYRRKKDAERDRFDAQGATGQSTTLPLDQRGEFGC